MKKNFIILVFLAITVGIGFFIGSTYFDKIGKTSYTIQYQDVDLDTIAGEGSIMSSIIQNNHLYCFIVHIDEETSRLYPKLTKTELNTEITTEILLPHFDKIKTAQSVPQMLAMREKSDGSLVLLLSADSEEDTSTVISQTEYLLYEVTPDGKIITAENLTQTINSNAQGELPLTVWEAYFTSHGELYIACSSYQEKYMLAFDTTGKQLSQMAAEDNINCIFCDSDNQVYIVTENVGEMELRAVDISNQVVSPPITLGEELPVIESGIFLGIAKQKLLLNSSIYQSVYCDAMLAICELKTGKTLTKIDISGPEFGRSSFSNMGFLEDERIWIIARFDDGDAEYKLLFLMRN